MNFLAFLKKSWAKPLLVFIIATIFFSWNLEGQYYQLDEAGTILQSEGIANLGYPSGWDGRTLISDNNGREYELAKGSFFYTWQPPLQSYTAYIGGKLFGKTVFGYRILFVLFGAGTVALFYHCASLLFKNRRIVYLVTAQLLLLLPFFLYIRQVRYYALSAFFSTVFLYLFLKAWKREWGRQEVFLLFLASTFLFLTNYFVWAGSVAFLALFFLWQKNTSGVVTLILTGVLPVVWYLTVHPFAGNPTGAYHRDTNFLFQFYRYLPYIHSYLFPLFLLPIFFMGKRTTALVYVLGLLIFFKLALYAVLLDTHGSHLIDVMPVCMLLFGLLYTSLDTARTRLLIPVIFLSVLVIANLGSFLPKAFLENNILVLTTPFVYRAELARSYPTLLEPIAAYLQQSYQEGDIFWTNNFRDSVTVRSGIPHFSPVCDLATNRPLGPAAVSTRENIRWFIFFQGDPRLPQNVTKEPCLGLEWQRVLERDYVRSSFTMPPGYYLINDPDIVGRIFPPQEAKPNQVIIYERKDYVAKGENKKLETLITNNLKF